MGELGPLIERFIDDVAADGHSASSLVDYCMAARQFAKWTQQVRIDLQDIGAGSIERYARHRCPAPSRQRSTRASGAIHHVRRFVDFLAEQQLIRPIMPPPARLVDARILRFREWLRIHRGLTDRTIELHGGIMMRLLPALGPDPASYDASLIRCVITDAAKAHSPAGAKNIVSALRSYLRFLSAAGECRPWLDQAVPTVPQWRLSALPRYLSPPDIERLIVACDIGTSLGVRDRAILLLLARLGLRAGDIVALRLRDIAWEEGTIRVDGKGRRAVLLPLPQDAGDAVLAYLDGARPRVACDHVFLRGQAPFGPFRDSSAISCLVDAALTRAGIESAPTRGANLLRHSAATGMLRAGATLDGIGAVLRHRSADTTAHYAKVDVAMLQTIIQPWPGEVAC
jgi:site-specific recombinase XerD